MFNFAGDRLCLADFTLRFGCSRLSRAGSSSSLFIDVGGTFSIESNKTSHKPSSSQRTSVRRASEGKRSSSATPKADLDRTEPRQHGSISPPQSRDRESNSPRDFRTRSRLGVPARLDQQHPSGSPPPSSTSMADTTSGGGDWSFSLRSNRYHHAMSSSDDDSDDDLCRPAPSSLATSEKIQPSEEARLLGELDLASRTDAASYKPNPWSIAKANAAIRGPRPRPSAPKEKKQNTTQPTAPDLLRAQPKTIPIKRVHQMQSAGARPAVQVRELTSSKSENPDHLVSDDAHIPSDDTLVDNTLDPVVFSKLGDNESTLPPSLSLLSAGGTPPSKAAIPDPQVCPSDPASPSPYSYLIDPRLVGTHHRIPMEDPPSPPERLSDGQELRAILFHSKPLNSHTLKESSISQPSQPTHTIAAASTTATRSLFPGKWHLPTLLVQLMSLCRHYLEFVSSIAPTAGSRSPSFIRPRSSVPILSFEASNDLHSRPSYEPSARSSPIPSRAYSPPIRDPTRCPISSPHRYNIEPRPPQAKAIGLRQTLDQFAFRPPSPSLPPFAQPLATRQPSFSPSPRHSRSSPQLSGSRASRLSATSILQDAPPRKVPRRCAYEAFSSPDSSWSTILPGKNHKQKGRNKTKPVTTSNFRLRLQPARPTNESRKGREDNASDTADAKPKVVTYLPPPLRPLPRGRNIDGGHEANPSLSNQSGSVISPNNQDSHPPSTFHPMAIRRGVPPHMSLHAYRAPTSSPYSPSRRHGSRSERPSSYHEATHNMGSDKTLSFNQSGLPHRYSSVRRGIAKVGSFVGQTTFCPYVTPWYVLSFRGLC